MTVIGVLVYRLYPSIRCPRPALPGGAFNTVFYLGIGFGIGYGTYQAVDWALGTDVLPNKDTDAAKDLGVWHIAFVLPQSLRPAGGVAADPAAAGGRRPATAWSSPCRSSISSWARCWCATSARPVHQVRKMSKK